MCYTANKAARERPQLKEMKKNGNIAYILHIKIWESRSSGSALREGWARNKSDPKIWLEYSRRYQKFPFLFQGQVDLILIITKRIVIEEQNINQQFN